MIFRTQSLIYMDLQYMYWTQWQTKSYTENIAFIHGQLE